MTTISDAFHLPRPEDIRAMGFVMKLRESDTSCVTRTSIEVASSSGTPGPADRVGHSSCPAP